MRVPVILIIISYISIILMDWYIWNDCKIFRYDKFFRVKRKKSSSWGWAFLVFSFLVLALFTVAVCLPHRSLDQDIQPKMWLLYTFLTVYIGELIYVVFSLLGYFALLFRRKKANTGLYCGLPLALIVFAFMWWGAGFGRKMIDVNTVEIVSPRIPVSFNGYKMMQISDMHLGTWGNDTSFVSRLVDSVNMQKPDVVFFTGDIVNRATDEMTPFLKTLARIKAKDGVFAVLGNHDYGDYMVWESPEAKAANMARLRDNYKKIGWRLLDNQHVFLTNNQNDSIALIGVENWGEPPFHQYGRLDDAYPLDKQSDYNVNDHRFKILLSHNPEHWNQIISKSTNIDLTLSGHTHAMQIIFKLGPFRWSPSQYRYEQWSGLYERENLNNEKVQLYVNIGSGEVGMPMRIGATPEITTLILRHQ